MKENNFIVREMMFDGMKIYKILCCRHFSERESQRFTSLLVIKSLFNLIISTFNAIHRKLPFAMTFDMKSNGIFKWKFTQKYIFVVFPPKNRKIFTTLNSTIFSYVKKMSNKGVQVVKSDSLNWKWNRGETRVFSNYMTFTMFTSYFPFTLTIFNFLIRFSVFKSSRRHRCCCCCWAVIVVYAC